MPATLMPIVALFVVVTVTPASAADLVVNNHVGADHVGLVVNKSGHWVAKQAGPQKWADKRELERKKQRAQFCKSGVC